MKIDKALPVPLYQQVKQYLYDKITSGEWTVGHQLPAEKELAKQFDVSNITVKRAVLELVDDGLLRRQVGKGTFVTQIEEKDITKFVSLKNEAWETHHHPHKTLSFKTVRAGSKLSTPLHVEKDDIVYQIHRLKMQQNEPVAMEYSFIPQSLFPDLQQPDIENDLLYNIFQRKYGVQLDKAKIYFSTILADDYEADILRVPKGEQLFVFERFTSTKDKHIIEYSRFIVKQDQSKYFLEIQL
ncbi:GntR family transcriptional regulator [Virgibacillus sp. 179-BFC.A HS]|uniref:GntR family transcriptional regulator n=1 Tax=Tigheibacillus jepli TaxID=3035914 RepID=A0ABU5CL44_9BACI|nr:GntR family transcriptional regulator [Virgibacillus sp. 179-BFC.A HS]MDY0406529.1 GntR family transcriptional regulator [Virgibacillus sp. 179-BFC.A HS]